MNFIPTSTKGTGYFLVAIVAIMVLFVVVPTLTGRSPKNLFKKETPAA